MAPNCPALRAWERGSRRSSGGRSSEARDGGAICKERDGSTQAFRLRARAMGWIRRATPSAEGRAGGEVPVRAGPHHGLPRSHPEGAEAGGAQRLAERNLGALAPAASPRWTHARRRAERVPGARAAQGGGLRVHKENGLHAPLPWTREAPQGARGPSTPGLRLLLH